MKKLRSVCLLCGVLLLAGLSSCLTTGTSSSSAGASASGSSSGKSSGSDEDALRAEFMERFKRAKGVKTEPATITEETFELSGAKVFFEPSWFAKFEKDSRVRFTVTKKSKTNSIIELYSPASNLLTKGSMSNCVNDEYGTHVPVKDGEIVYEVTAEEAELLKKNGLYISGSDLVISKVEAIYVRYIEFSE